MWCDQITQTRTLSCGGRTYRTIIASVVSFLSARYINLGSGVSNTVHIDQSEYHFGTFLYPFGVNQYSVLPSTYNRSRFLSFSKRCTVRCWICPAIKKRRREPRRDGISLVKQDAAHKGFCWTFPLYRPLRSLEQIRTQGFLRIESTAVQRCARKSTGFASGSNIVGESHGIWNFPQ